VILSIRTTQYSVLQKVAEAVGYRVYLCKGIDNDQQFLLQIATETAYNGGLDRAAFILKELKQTSDSCEEEYAKLHPGEKVNYDQLFPTLIDSFISDEQGQRRINILALKDVATIQKMVPLSTLKDRDQLRISLETSGWIMGRLLKLLSFTHPQGISVRQLDSNNILIDLERHHVVVFNWSQSQTYIQEVVLEQRRQDIIDAAKAVFLAIGGDINTGVYQYDPDHEYSKFIWNLAWHNDGDARKAHAQYYELVHRLFGHGYIPSKTIPL